MSEKARSLEEIAAARAAEQQPEPPTEAPPEAPPEPLTSRDVFAETAKQDADDLRAQIEERRQRYEVEAAAAAEAHARQVAQREAQAEAQAKFLASMPVPRARQPLPTTNARGDVEMVAEEATPLAAAIEDSPRGVVLMAPNSVTTGLRDELCGIGLRQQGVRAPRAGWISFWLEHSTGALTQTLPTRPQDETLRFPWLDTGRPTNTDPERWIRQHLGGLVGHGALYVLVPSGLLSEGACGAIASEFRCKFIVHNYAADGEPSWTLL